MRIKARQQKLVAFRSYLRWCATELPITLKFLHTGSVLLDYLNYVTYLAALVCPFVCIMALSEVRKKLIIIYRTTYCYKMIPQQRVRPLLTGVTGTAITANGGGNERGGDTTVIMLKPMVSTVVVPGNGDGNFVPETKKR
ncbi:unnamed protein product [Didymodactylos carnosus]|uniref:Uncharacterized protein n=1 Tax=Didymodactylos carnosus TaxID=1234261 RepID=A0A8S2EWH6_9BILA|nr:unnamed protein product [Didymodactylos carnosus]CAF4077846.1 unnamed protein product [Didymodactylos carnosus]